MEHGLNDLSFDLTAAGATITERIVPALEHSAQIIEDQAKEWAPKTGLAHYADTINHDVTIDLGGASAEIGADKSVNGQAKLAHLLEYGSVNNAPFAHLGPAFDREVPGFVDALATVGGDIL